MDKKIKIETTRVTINVETGGETGMSAGLVSNIVQAILQHGHLGANVVELDRNDEAASLTIEVKSELYDENGGYVYEEDPDFAEVAQTGQATDGAAAEPEKEDDCDCPACQVRRMLTVGLDTAKPGSDRSSIFLSTPFGLIRLA